MKKFEVEELECVKSFRRFLINALIITIIFVIIFFVTMFLVEKRVIYMNEILKEVIISLISGVVSSVLVTIVAYFKFLKRIPEDTTDKINKLLNDRLSYETNNHNCTMNALSPNNGYLSTEHRVIQQELGNIKENVISIKEKRNVDYSIVDDVGKNILHSIDNLSKFSDLFVELNKKNVQLEKDNKNLETELKVLQQKYENLEKENLGLNRNNELSKVCEGLKKNSYYSNKYNDIDLER